MSHTQEKVEGVGSGQVSEPEGNSDSPPMALLFCGISALAQ